MHTRARNYKDPTKAPEDQRVIDWLLSEENKEVQPKEVPLDEPLPNQEPLQGSVEMSKSHEQNHMRNWPPSEKDIKVEPSLYEPLPKQELPQDPDADSEISYTMSDIIPSSFIIPCPDRKIKEMSHLSFKINDFSYWTGKDILRFMNALSDLQYVPSESLGAGIASVIKSFKALKESKLEEAAYLAEYVETEYKEIAKASVWAISPEVLRLITYTSQDRIKTTSSNLGGELSRYDLTALLDISCEKLEEQILHESLKDAIRNLRSKLYDVFREFKRSAELMEENIENDFKLLISHQNHFETFQTLVKLKLPQKRQEKIDKWIMKHHREEKLRRRSKKRKREKKENEQKERIATIWARVPQGRVPTLPVFLLFSLVYFLMNYFTYSPNNGLPAKLQSEWLRMLKI